MKKYIIIYLLSLLSIQVLAGGGWPQPKGKGYFKFNQSMIRAGQFYDLGGNKIDITTISLYTSNIYAEYGLSDRLTGILYMPVFVRSTLNHVERRQSGMSDPGDAVNSFGDTDIGIKYGLTKGRKIAVAASLIFGLPLGKTAEGTTESGDPRILQTGDGEFNQFLTLEASRSFSSAHTYATVGAAFNNRAKNFSDELRFFGEVGYTGFSRFSLILKAYQLISLHNGASGGGSGNGVFGNNIEFFTVSPEVNYDLGEHIGLSVSSSFGLSGRNVLAAPNYNIGLYMKI